MDRSFQSFGQWGKGALNKKSLHGSNRNGSRYSVSSRSNQAAITRSEYNVVESFGIPLPVMVNEALTFSERNVVVSINCSSNGWAWAVSGRRLLIWQFKEVTCDPSKSENVRTPQRRTGQCRELTLPHCDIGHKASLITVMVSEGQQMASCLAVSPTGDVRYWPSIAHDGSSIDESGILEGQEFDDLVNMSPQGFILVTTTCSLVFLQIQLFAGRHAIVHRGIKPPSGFFGGIGKKFASIIIGMHGAADRENKFLKVCAAPVNQSTWNLSILADRFIQRWKFSSTANELFLFEDVDIVRKIRDAFHQKLWPNRDYTEIEVWLLDMQSVDGGVVVLASAVNMSHSPQVQYGLASAFDEDTVNLGSFCLLKHHSFYTGKNDEEYLKSKFILNRAVAYVYTDRFVYPVLMNGAGNDELEKIEFHGQGDKIMVAAVYNGLPVFFSRLHGLVCVSPSDFEPGDVFNQSVDGFNPGSSLTNDNLQSVQLTNTSNIGNLTIYELDPEEIYNNNSDVINQTKAAFIYHVKRNTTASATILNALFPLNIPTLETDAQLDRVVITLCQDMVNDIPAADPRWEQQFIAQQISLASSTSMQIIQQLREKRLALSHFIDFLHAMGLWERLGSISNRGIIKSTCHQLSDLCEKIVAAYTLKSIHSNFADIVDKAIQKVLEQRGENAHGNLTHQDVFYVKLTKFHEIFKVLVEQIDELARSDLSAGQVSAIISDISLIILTILKDVFKYRDSKRDRFAVPAEKVNSFEVAPWTAMSGKNGIRESLIVLIQAVLKYGIRSSGEPELRQKHFQQMVDLIDFVLDGRRNYLESIRGTEKYGVALRQYETQRFSLIFPLIEESQFELAAKLAEKYYDFETLVILCDKTENQDRLNDYIKRFKHLNFSQFAINWHLQQNKQGDLFERFRGNQSDLSEFLGDHPSLAWVQLIFNGEMCQASNVLHKLAQSETELAARKNAMLSLAKLSAFASEEPTTTTIEQLNSELILLEHQEQLPAGVLDAFGYDRVNAKVLRAEEIVNLYISDENEEATELVFRKALELLPYVEEPFEVRHKIWCAAILRDSWDSYNVNSPLDSLQNMMFFKLIELCFLLDSEVDQIVPAIEDFENAAELGDLVHRKSFQFLLKLGYEHVNEVYRKCNESVHE